MVYKIRKAIAYIILNIWLLLQGAKVSYCPKCDTPAMWIKFGIKHCENCEYHEGLTAWKVEKR